MAARLGRVHVNVRDLGRAARFYTKVIGLRVHHQSADAVFLSAGEGPWHVALHASAGTPDPASALGCRAAGFELSGAGELARSHDALVKAGAPVMAVDQGATWSIHTEDPDGNAVELYCEAPAGAVSGARWGAGRVLDPSVFEAWAGASV
jgi:catechol 2,3-dioxygenase